MRSSFGWEYSSSWIERASEAERQERRQFLRNALGGVRNDMMERLSNASSPPPRPAPPELRGWCFLEIDPESLKQLVHELVLHYFGEVGGLKLGADDYLTKPFEPLELLARLEALQRRNQPQEPEKPAEVFRFGPVTVNFRGTEVRRNNQVVELSAREFSQLRFFIEQRGATLSRQQLLVKVWGYDAETLTRTVDVHVAMLRQKLEDDAKQPRHFVTVRGMGYKFVDQPGGGND